MSPRSSKPSPQKFKPASRPTERITDPTSLNATHGRNALQVYIRSPSSFPSSIVLAHNESFVSIHDAFPKSSLHTLLLPRDPHKSLQHPFDALADPDFLAQVRARAAWQTTLVAAELRRMYGAGSAADAARNAALDADPPPAQLPAGRDWEAEVMVGVHAHPSMTHLHVHIMSVDRRSECVKHRKHYNSFSTLFFVDLKDFPLAVDDPRRHPGREGYLDSEFKCWRCGKGYGKKFKALKDHLEEEFQAWKKE